MRYFALLCKINFVFNLLFLAAALLSYSALGERNPDVFAVLLVGYVLSVFIMNPVTNLITVLLWLFKKAPQTFVAQWLLWTNFAFQILQIIFIFLLNDTINH